MNQVPRAIDALREWLGIRSRVREERQFHLELAAEEFRALGLTPNAAIRAARRRFGYYRNLRLARRELGGDVAGLGRIFAAHDIPASPCFQPNALLAAAVLILLLSPAPRALIEGVAGQPPAAADRNAIFLFAQQPNPSFVGISASDSYKQWHHSKARVSGPGVHRQSIIMGPARAAWGLIALSSVFLLRAFSARIRRSYRWLLYAMATGCLHAVASLMAWALGVQVWSGLQWSTDGHAALAFVALLAAYLGATALQLRYWWHDLHRRCPVCLGALVLPLTEGTADRVLLGPATTESVCAHGHGVLVENRWSRRFRPEESPLEGLIRV